MIQITEIQYRKYQLYETYLYNLLSQAQIRLSLINEQVKVKSPNSDSTIFEFKERIEKEIKILQELLNQEPSDNGN
jgi:hypothetical protein